MATPEDACANEWFRTFEDFVASRGQFLTRQVRLMVMDDYLADDIVADVFAKVWRKWARIRKLESPDAYIQSMIANACRSYWRKASTRRERPTVMDAIPEGEVEDHALRQARDDQLEHCIRRLSNRQRIAIVLRFYPRGNEAPSWSPWACCSSSAVFLRRV